MGKSKTELAEVPDVISVRVTPEEYRALAFVREAKGMKGVGSVLRVMSLNRAVKFYKRLRAKLA